MTNVVEPLLELKALFLEREGRIILDGLDLALQAGEIHALLGANGSGKSSLAYAVMGCEGYLPDSGEMLFQGRSIKALPLYQRARLGITLAWQEPARFEGVKIGDYVRTAGAETDVADCLRKVGLPPERYADRPADVRLSGGERKRVELAAVLAMRPRLAILDEPTAGIDMLSLQALTYVITTLKTAGSSVLLITHQAALAQHADTASQLCAGRILYRGHPDEVMARYRARQCPRCDGEHCRD